MAPTRDKTQYPERLRKFVETIETNVRASGRSAKEARLYGAWSACYVRFCTLKNRDWQQVDNVLPFLKYLKVDQQVNRGSLRRAAEGLLFVFEEMMGRSLGDVAWRPPSRSSSRPASGTSESASRTEGSSRPPDRSASPSRNGHASSSSRTSGRREASPSNSASQTSSSTSSQTGSPSSEAEEPRQSSMLTRLLFHTSLPIQEALDLRAGDVDFDAGMIYVSDAMGTPKRIVEIPEALVGPLQQHVREARRDYPGKPLDAPLFQANALKGRTAPSGDTASSDASSDDADDAPLPPSDDEEPVTDGESRPSLWHYAGS